MIKLLLIPFEIKSGKTKKRRLVLLSLVVTDLAILNGLAVWGNIKLNIKLEHSGGLSAWVVNNPGSAIEVEFNSEHTLNGARIALILVGLLGDQLTVVIDLEIEFNVKFSALS